jgi:hypothetical protein
MGEQEPSDQILTARIKSCLYRTGIQSGSPNEQSTVQILKCSDLTSIARFSITGTDRIQLNTYDKLIPVVHHDPTIDPHPPTKRPRTRRRAQADGGGIAGEKRSGHLTSNSRSDHIYPERRT